MKRFLRIALLCCINKYLYKTYTIFWSEPVNNLTQYDTILDKYSYVAGIYPFHHTPYMKGCYYFKMNFKNFNSKWISKILIQNEFQKCVRSDNSKFSNPQDSRLKWNRYSHLVNNFWLPFTGRLNCLILLINNTRHCLLGLCTNCFLARSKKKQYQGT